MALEHLTFTPADWCTERDTLEVTLAGRAWRGQEHISRARCPSTVPAFIRCSLSRATAMPQQLWKQPFSPPPDFPTKLLLFLLQLPQHHLRSLSERLHRYTCPLLGSVLPEQQKYS